MPRTIGSKNRSKEVIEAAKNAAEERRQIRLAHGFKVRGRLPGGINFVESIRYTTFKVYPTKTFDESTAEVVAE